MSTHSFESRDGCEISTLRASIRASAAKTCGNKKLFDQPPTPLARDLSGIWSVFLNVKLVRKDAHEKDNSGKLPNYRNRSADFV